MTYLSKLKPDSNFTGMFQPVIAIFIFIIVLSLAGLEWALFSLAIIYFLYTISSIIQFIKSSNYFFFFPATFQLFLGIYVLTVPKGLFPLTKQESNIFFAVALLFMFISLILLLTKKLKWKGREIFELAAKDVVEGDGSFTERPKPLPKIDYPFQKVSEFAYFFRQNLLGLTYEDGKQIYFLPIQMGLEYGPIYNPNYNFKNKTWVSVTNSGEVIVHITKEDYLEYKYNLSFNELCDSLGNLFIEFIELNSKGEQVRILDKINTVSNSIFS